MLEEATVSCHRGYAGMVYLTVDSDGHRDRQALTALVEKANGLVRRLEIQAPTDRQQRPCLDLDLATLAGAAAGGEEPGE